MITGLILIFILSTLTILLSPLGVVSNLVFFIGDVSIDLANLITQAYAWYAYFTDIFEFMNYMIAFMLAGIFLESAYFVWQIFSKVAGWIRGSA